MATLSARGSDPFSSFRRAARDAVVSVDVSRLDGEAFRHFHLRHIEVEELRLCDVTCDPICIERKPIHIENDGVGDGVLTFQLAGEVHISQSGREFALRPGDLAIMSADAPYRVAYKRPCRRLFICIPSAEFAERVTGGESLPRVRHLHQTPMGRIVSSLLMSVATEANVLDAEDSHLVAESLLEILASINRHDDGEAHRRLAETGAASRDRILEYMERNFRDPELGPKQIALAANVSLRRLHALFGANGTTVARWLWERRLQASYEALQNPRRGHLSISEIAFTSGFSDAAHFSRAFRKRFGMTPTEVRRAAGVGPSGPS